MIRCSEWNGTDGEPWLQASVVATAAALAGSRRCNYSVGQFSGGAIHAVSHTQPQKGSCTAQADNSILWPRRRNRRERSMAEAVGSDGKQRSIRYSPPTHSLRLAFPSSSFFLLKLVRLRRPKAPPWRSPPGACTVARPRLHCVSERVKNPERADKAMRDAHDDDRRRG